MKKVKTNKLGRRILSFVLTVALMVGLMPGNILTVSAEGIDTVISDELIVESVSSNDASSTTECTCGTDAPAFHATNCPAYIAPENPQCYCAEKCTDDTLNVWCDVCGMQGVSACQGEDTAVAYEIEIVANGNCGAEGNESSVTWSLDSDGTLTISGSGAMWDYYTGDKRAPWNVHKDNITTVIIEEGVTTIGTYAFWMCAQLTEITISATVTTIGDRAFFNCERLIQITIPQSVTSIGEGVFAGCSSITSVTLPNSISTIQEDTFLGCKSLTSLTIPKGVTTIGPGAFYNCTSLNSITIPEGVTTIGNFAFSGCTSLETIVIPSSVTTIGAGAFDEVPGVSSEDGFLIINGILMKYTGDAENVEIPSGVTSINDNAFAHNYSIVSVKIPSGVTKLGIQAFGRCDSLVSVELPETLISMDNSFIYCGKLEEITIPSGMKTIGRYAFYDCTSLAKVTIPNSVTEIGDEAFDNIAANATINAPCSWNENPLYSFADGITVNIPAHQNLTYSVNDEGNVINNECSNCGKVGGTLTINAEDGIYDGTTKYGATVEKTGTLENKEVTVKYYQGDTLIGTDAPVDVGIYTAKITYEDVTASVTFTITRAFEVTGGTEGVDYTYENGVLTINTSPALTIKNTDPSTPTTDRIEVATGISANITLAGVNIDVSATENTAAFKIADNSTGNVTITLADGTTNTLKSGKYCAGLQKNGGTSTGMLTIQGETAGTGVLNAIGADYGAGIGGDENSSGCNITISGGIVTAQCDDEVGAGIGGGEWGSGRNITISGGTVTVQGGSDSAGIGGGILGYGSNIEISGGSVKVVAGYGAPAIGDGRAYGGAVTPTDGTNDVYLLELTVDGTSAVTINGSTNYPKKHFEENKLYVYLPAKTAQAPNEVTIGSTTTKYTYDTTNSKWLTVVDAPEADINKFTCNGVELTYTLAESDYYTISGNKQTNAGTYTVTVSLKENTVWSDGTTDDKEYPFTITYTDADNDGICDDCGSYDEPVRVDGDYQIANAGNLMWLAEQVNKGPTAINAKLTADIAMNGIDWTIMSSFAGTFDGNGYTISGLNGHKADTGDTHGFIRTLADGGVVKNLTFTEADIWNHEGPGAISAVIVYTNNGTVENCVVKESVIQHGNYDALGVVVGVNGGTIRNCASISNTMTRRFSSAKDICGFVWSNSGSIENCFNYDCTYQNGSNRYAFTQSNTGTITNCYYYESSETISDTVVTAKTADQFAGGEVAYLLNGDQTTIVWGQTLTGENKQACPVLGGAKVYYGYTACNSTEKSYSNSEIGNEKPQHIFEEDSNGFCTVCGAYEQPETDEKGVYQISNAGELYWFAEYVNAGNTSANAVLTADIVVNSGKVAECNGTKGAGWKDWTPIGNYSNRYTGTFEGNNKTISGLYFNDTNADYVGLFGCIDNDSEIKNVGNVGVVNSYFKGKDYVGGVCGNNYEGTITNCYNTGSVSGSDYVGGVCGRNYDTITNCYNTGTVVGAYYVGGVCGYNITSNTGSYTITNCYNTGSISGTYYVGGVCGKNYGKITNCYNTGTVVGAYFVGGVCSDNNGTTTNCYNTGIVTSTEDHDYVGGVCGRNSGTITNCYYLGESETDSISGTTFKTQAQFASGEVAYLLNGSTSENVTWYQTLETDTYPVLDSKHGIVYSVFKCDGTTPAGYSNVNEPVHDYTHTVVPPTYYEEGYTLHECVGMDDSYEDNYTDKLVLPAISNLALKSRNYNSITLSWAENEAASGYILQQYKNNAWVNIANIKDNATTSYQITGLAANTSYKFRAVAYVTDGESTAYSSYTSALTISTAPAMNANFAITGRGSDYLTITWTKNAGASGYIIQEQVDGVWKNVASIKGNATTSYTVANLQPNSFHRYRMVAYKTDANGTCYGKYTGSAPGYTAPAMVSGFKVSGIGADSLTVSWDKVTSANGYVIDIYRDGKWSQLAKINSNATTSYKASGLTLGTTYKFRIKSYATNGTLTINSTYSSAISGVPTLSKVTNLRMTNRGTDFISVRWDKNESADGYMVYIYDGTKWTCVKTLTTASSVSHKITGLESGKAYKVTVKAYKTVNGKKFISDTATISANTL